MRVATAQLPPSEDSDDKIFTTSNAVIVLDGASAFVPVPVPASTYADCLGRELVACLTAHPEADLRAVLAEAIEQSAKALELEPGKSPSSTVTMLRESNGVVDVLRLGDSVAVLPQGVLTDERMDDLDLTPRREYRQRLADGGGYDETHRALLRELQTQQGRYRNQDGGFWIAEASPEAAQHALVRHHPASAVPWAVLATDGAFNTMTHTGVTDWPAISQSSADELAAILERCQQWERDQDPDARQFPRAKRHDDKAIAAVRLSS
ncbi:hypothetical protein GCM10027445_12060 [Amycolatopsis endophytica]|nr:hypothetical protein [Amycolatopsis endophytica]